VFRAGRPAAGHEALRRPSSEGLVEVIPQADCRVLAYSGADVSDFFAIFGGMGAVAGIVSQRCTDAQVYEFAAFRGDQAPHRRTRQGRSLPGTLVLNCRLCDITQDMAPSAVVTGISRRVWDTSDLLINTTGVSRPLASTVPARHDDHKLIIRAPREHDQAGAQRGMEDHIIGIVTIINTEARAVR
jgi:DNA-binding GntR family transcriptional regulator